MSGTQSKGRFFFLIPILRVLSHLLHKQTKPFLTRKAEWKGECGDDIQHENRYYLPKSKKQIHSKATTVKSCYKKKTKHAERT